MMSFAENYQTVQRKMDEASKASGRNLSDIQLIVVTKNQTVEAVKEAYNAGCSVFGESKIQEAEDKIPLFPDCQWHLIGSLQKNKVGKALSLFNVIHSVDSVPLAQKISKLSVKPVSILLEVNISGEASKHGMSPDQWERELDAIHLPNLKVIGLTTMAPFTQNEKIIRPCFKQLHDLLYKWKGKMVDPSAFKELSMGMSNDYSIAIQEGATMIRLGTALFNGFDKNRKMYYN